MQSIDNFEIKKDAENQTQISYSDIKKAEREKAYNLIAEITEELKKNKQTFTDYLSVQSRFDRYSVSNALLILKQMPKATRLSDFETFKEEGRPIKKGQTAILLLTPGEEYTREDGSIGVAYNVKKVFDIGQTNNKAINETEIKQDIFELTFALIHNLPTLIEVTENVPSTSPAFYDQNLKKILARPNCDPTTQFKYLICEIGHAILDKENYSRPKADFTAKCVTFMVCCRYGIDTKDVTIVSLPDSYRGLDAKAMREELSCIRSTANEIFSRMDKNLGKQKAPQKQTEHFER